MNSLRKIPFQTALFVFIICVVSVVWCIRQGPTGVVEVSHRNTGRSTKVNAGLEGTVFYGFLAACSALIGLGMIPSIVATLAGSEGVADNPAQNDRSDLWE